MNRLNTMTDSIGDTLVSGTGYDAAGQMSTGNNNGGVAFHSHR